MLHINEFMLQHLFCSALLQEKKLLLCSPETDRVSLLVSSPHEYRKAATGI